MVKTEGKTVAGIERTRAAIKATAGVLMEQAFAALEGNHKPTLKPAPKKKSTAKERAALSALGASHTPLFTAEAIGENMTKIGLDFLATTDALGAVIEKITRAYDETSSRLPSGHPARKHLSAAKEALTNLEESLGSFDATDDANMPTPPARFLRAVGAVVVHFVSVSGQNMERAERELGEDVALCGWLEAIGQDKAAK